MRACYASAKPTENPPEVLLHMWLMIETYMQVCVEGRPTGIVEAAVILDV